MFYFSFRRVSIATICLWAAVISLCTAPGQAVALPIPGALEGAPLVARDTLINRDTLVKRPCGGVCKVSHDSPDLAGAEAVGIPVTSADPTPASEETPVETVPASVLQKTVVKTSGAFGRKENISPMLAWILAGTSTALYIAL